MLPTENCAPASERTQGGGPQGPPVRNLAPRTVAHNNLITIEDDGRLGWPRASKNDVAAVRVGRSTKDKFAPECVRPYEQGRR